MDATTRWIRSVAAALPQGGEDADQAIRTIGLMLQRETTGDDGVVALLDPDVAARRLIPLAFREAVDLLLAHLTQVRVPAPEIVWALTRSNDPRIVPHLAALLERVVDDPARQPVASQAVEGLTQFVDPRAVAAVRIAGERGQGDVRNRASWLERHAATAVPAGSAKVHAPASSIQFPVDADHLQRRPGSNEIVVNDGPDSLAVLDAATGRESVRVALSAGFPRDRRVRQWCLSADGTRAAVFGDGRIGSLVSFASGMGVDLEAPLDGEFEELRYLWDDRLIAAAGSGPILFGLVDGEPASFEKLRSLEVRRDHRLWMRCNDALMPLVSRVVRTEPREHRMLAYDFTEKPATHVVMAGDTSVELRVPASQYVPTLAYRPGQLFLLDDHEVQAVDTHGVITDVFPAPDGFYLRAGDIIGDSLVVAATHLDDPRRSAMVTYRLSS